MAVSLVNIIRTKYSSQKNTYAGEKVRVKYSNKRTSDGSIIIRNNYNYTIVAWFPKCLVRIRYNDTATGYDNLPVEFFPSMTPEITLSGGQPIQGNPTEPIAEEYRACLYTLLSINGSYVDGEDLIETHLRQKKGEKTYWTALLDNYDKVNNSSIKAEDLAGFHYKVGFGRSLLGPYEFKNLIVKGKTLEGFKLRLTGTCQISDRLFAEITLPTYTFKEILTPLASSKKTAKWWTGESPPEVTDPSLIEDNITYNKYRVLSISAHPPKYGCVLYINSMPEETLEDAKIGDDIDTPRTNNQLEVKIEKPLSAHWVIKDICSNIGISVKIEFEDFPIYASIPVQKTPPIKIIEKILEVIAGEWFINLATNNLILRQKLLKSEKPTTSIYVINDKLLKENTSAEKNSIQRINDINILSPVEIGRTYVKLNPVEQGEEG